MKRFSLLLVFVFLCLPIFAEISGPTKMLELTLDTSTTTVDVFSTFSKRAGQAQLVNDSDVDLHFETNEVAFTSEKIVVKSGETVKVPLSDGDRERIDTIIVTAASGTGKAARLLLTLWS